MLVAASRADHPHHGAALDWLDMALDASAAGAPFKVVPVVLAGFLRLVASPKILRRPTPIAAALAFVDAVLTSLGPERPTLRRLCLDRRLGGNDLPDAWLAAAVSHLGEHLVSFDRGFRKLLARHQFKLRVPA